MKSINIVICDDENAIHEEVWKLLEEYENKENFRYDLFDCYSGKELLELSTEYKIILLDIDMPEMDGIQTAAELSKKDEEKIIIMLTSKRERFKEAFKIGATRFVTKPIEKEELFEALDNAFFSLLGFEIIRLNYNGKECILQQREIQVIESHRDYLKIYSKEKIFESNKSLRSIQAELDERIFLSVHRSYIINVCHVCDVRKEYVKMDNGEKIPIARRKFREVLQKIIDFDKKRI
ncbi:MAG: response regulator transcription factor [Lachnospiraceae bacterium]|nr:response regulator transcription factor [Lachnospiraceae bacterium]